MKPVSMKEDISANFPYNGRSIICEASKLHLEYISSLNINEIYPQVTTLCSQIIHLYVTQRDPRNQNKDIALSGYKPLIFRTTQF